MKASGCPFCYNLEPQRASNHHAFSILDSRPVSPGHSLVISRDHAPTVFDLPPVEYAACFELVRELRELLVEKWKTKSLSVVMNCGAEANQTIQHAHIHFVPRHRDVPLPPAANVWSSLNNLWHANGERNLQPFSSAGPIRGCGKPHAARA